MIGTTRESKAATLSDQGARDRFVHEINHNFSVIAPAGVGKTTAIVARVVHYIESLPPSAALESSFDLVVVTYTQKAADEMEQRVRVKLSERDPSGLLSRLLKKVFFGTIHGFCLHLIKEHGLHLGLPTSLDLVVDDESLWREFFSQQEDILKCLDNEAAETFKKFLNINDVIELARKLDTSSLKAKTQAPPPPVALDELLRYDPDKRNAAAVQSMQFELRTWIAALESSELCIGLPLCSVGGKDFKTLWNDSFLNLWKWLGEAVLYVASDLSKKYFEYRLERKLITYDDMITLAYHLVCDTPAGEAIRQKGLRVLLDEAQDTDAKQFAIFQAITSSNEGDKWSPKPGHFSMVGDPQQAIYSDRAELPAYLKLHDSLKQGENADELHFTVTMRCDEQIVDFANKLFPSILRKTLDATQVGFVPLEARPTAGLGNVNRICLPLPEEGVDKEKHEAACIARWIAFKGLQGLGIARWGEFSILCPRRSWLTLIGDELHKNGIPYQISSSDKVLGDNPAFAWGCALLAIASNPLDSFEIAGVLREIFGISDHDIAVYVQNRLSEDKLDLHPLNILNPDVSGCVVGQTLKLLSDTFSFARQLSLRQTLDFWIRSCSLRERLALLPLKGKDSNKIIDDLLIQATSAEEKGTCLKDFAQKLSQDFNTPDQDDEELSHAVQLYTCHKSKGLQWKVVMLPYFFRPVSFAVESYPQYYPKGKGKGPVVAVADHSAKKEFSEYRAYMREKELERLLYVSLTRARNTLIFVDDSNLYNTSKSSFGDLSKVYSGGVNHHIWSQLGESLDVYESSEKTTQCDLGSDFLEDLHVDPSALDELSAHSQNYIKRLLPSALESTEPLPFHPNLHKVEEKNTALEYGVWWHEIVRELLLLKEHSSRDKTIDEYIARCPDSERGWTEINLFLSSQVSAMLFAQDWIIRTEVPFLWKNTDSSCFEGFIDLIAYNKNTHSSLVIDWKTNAVMPGEEPLLLRKYGPQVDVYVHAVAQMTGSPVEGYIYSTSTGASIKIDQVNDH